MQTFRSFKKDPRIKAASIFGLIAEEMQLVEEEFQRQADSNIQVISYLGDYLRQSGGKRVRPSLLLLANRAAGGDASSENVVRMATVMEILHTATLVHDDIIDNAEVRRSMPSVNARFGNQASVLMGDWLYMTAFEVSLNERSLEILDILTRLTLKMTEGELLQLTVIGRSDISEETYFDILQRKTAFLFSACCEIGGLLAGASKEQRDGLRDFGKNLGTAFQLADDVLDFTADKEVLGKASGADLIEGKLTLPLISLLQKDPGQRELIEKIMHDGEYEGDSREQLLGSLETSGTLDETRRRAHDFAAQARENLAKLPENEYRLALEGVPALMIEREN
jgi:octaprenyl-diphosphate synthase